MNRGTEAKIIGGLIALVLGGLLLRATLDKPAAPPPPAPTPAPAPPAPPPAPKPKRPWGPGPCASVDAPRRSVSDVSPAAFVQTFEEAKVGGNLAPDGKTEIQCDLPKQFHITNCGGSDGAGLCVFASITHSSIWQHCRQTENLFQWMKRYPGGGYPAKVDAKIAQISKEQGMELPEYIQIESRDLEPLRRACATRRMPGVTYGYSPTGRYGGRHISHMTSLVHCDERWVGILDNNYPGTIEWMDPQTFLGVYTSGARNGWAVILLGPPPPPAPRNRSQSP